MQVGVEKAKGETVHGDGEFFDEEKADGGFDFGLEVVPDKRDVVEGGFNGKRF